MGRIVPTLAELVSTGSFVVNMYCIFTINSIHQNLVRIYRKPQGTN